MKLFTMNLALIVSAMAYSGAANALNGTYKGYHASVAKIDQRVQFSLYSPALLLFNLSKVKPVRKCSDAGTGPSSCDLKRNATLNLHGNVYEAYQSETENAFFGGINTLNLDLDMSQIVFENDTQIVFKVPNLTKNLGGMKPFEKTFETQKISYSCASENDCTISYQNLFGI